MLDSKAMSYIVMVQFYVESGKDSMCYLSKVSELFPCSSKGFINSRLSSTKLLIQ